MRFSMANHALQDHLPRKLACSQDQDLHKMGGKGRSGCAQQNLLAHTLSTATLALKAPGDLRK